MISPMVAPLAETSSRLLVDSYRDTLAAAREKLRLWGLSEAQIAAIEARGTPEDHITINAPIGRHPVDRRKMSIRDDGKPAVTHYRVLERFRAHTYISVKLETGRTHQIRVHFAQRRNPLLGDPVYGGRLQLPSGASSVLVDALRAFRRQALHATRLQFSHPASGESIDVSSSPPADLSALLDDLRADLETDE